MTRISVYLLHVAWLLCVGMTILAPGRFLSVQNATSMAFQFPEFAILALAMTITMLTDSSGNAVALSASSNGLASDISVKTIGGKVRLVAGRSGGGVSNQPGTFGRGGTLRRLNWREVPMQQ